MLLIDVIAGSIYVCSALAMMGFVFGWPLQGLLATSGILAIVLGLALQSTLSDLFSGILYRSRTVMSWEMRFCWKVESKAKWSR